MMPQSGQASAVPSTNSEPHVGRRRVKTEHLASVK